MSLVVNHNLMAAGAARNLNTQYGRLATSTQRLSSGLRINGASDDAAGLAIRELMRADVATLNQGIRNANDAISMLQVADGALGVIDEKLIRMKELSEQAATGTYNSTQRLMIDSEFQAMGAEIDRIANATDFNGVKLLDGSLAGEHNGQGLQSTGKMKIHFGSGNDSAEDYYYVEIGDCTMEGLGLGRGNTDELHYKAVQTNFDAGMFPAELTLDKFLQKVPQINDLDEAATFAWAHAGTLQDTFAEKGHWYWVQDGYYSIDTSWNQIPGSDPDLPASWVVDTSNYRPINTAMFVIPKGTKNILINAWGYPGRQPGELISGDNDLQLFTRDGKHLAGTPLSDEAWNATNDLVVEKADGTLDILPGDAPTPWDIIELRLGFPQSSYDASNLNTGPAAYDPTGQNLNFSSYNGMTIGYSGDRGQYGQGDMADYEVLFIDEAKEDLLVYYPGYATGAIKAYWTGDSIDIKTQDKAQQALDRINAAIVKKDQIRAHIGALQNRLENTITNLSIQAESLQASESRISDVDVATEMTQFVRNQILTQSAVAMLSQANALPQMALQLIGG